MNKDRQEISHEVLCAEYEAVYRYSLSICKDATEAQDITQETFLKAMKAMHRFKGESSLYTWLCTIAKNLWINKCRKSKKEYMLESWEDYTSDSKTSMEEAAADKDLSLQIHRILHNIQEPYKEVFSLRVFGQLSFSDIAGLFGKTESWARVTYHRARKMLHEALGKEGLL